MPLFKPGAAAGRPKSAQLGSIRGRISGPIMVDDEFPIRTPGSGIAHLGSPVDLHSSPSASPDEDNQVRNDPLSDQPNGDVLQQSHFDRDTTPSTEPRQASQATAARFSTASHATGNDTPQRKKSTFRSALSKLFGRKKRDTHSRNSGAETPYQAIATPDQHRSQPPARRDSPMEQSEPKRSFSLPVTEYERALRSHSVGPTDMLAIESARNSMLLEPAMLKKRAASSSLIVSPVRRDFDGELIGLTPRPASINGEIHVSNEELQDPNEIGRALSVYESSSQRPRSKSLTGMPALAEAEATSRNRNDEIRYWRESYQPRSLSPTNEDAHESASHKDSVNDATAETPRTVPPSFPLSPEELRFQTPTDSPVLSPQQFAYAAPSLDHAHYSEMSLEERVVALEAHTRKLEKLVSQLFELVSGGAALGRPGNAVPRSPQSLDRSAAQYGTSYSTTLRENAPSSRQSDESFGDAYTYVGSNPAPPIITERMPSNNTSVREATSLPTLPRDFQPSLGADHYTTLKALLDTERVNRQMLEAQVTKLSYRLNRLSRASQTLDSRKRGLYSAFDDDDDDYEGLPSATDGYGSEIFQTPHEEYNAAALQALSGFSPDAAGDNFDNDSDKENQGTAQRKAPRTLSLGQLTLPKSSRIPTDGDVHL
ncbi:uncharacterized protein B0I36DRAFT_88686 [Microdochium trichocladiopsis]|uniref:Uncharacterized protein n=1 Tax=Microdochium trichocladiopsis TaxID=1682393 RepID=A0A9P8YBR9_9PEZI|nr:uncharacterized protein B0I36DRAFT_88686 [Microdochium trichocladiopsis]KAH7035139.1 hypothetical protein B0I36DRAFT_88686 [Microdochium trichocladiopsis]